METKEQILEKVRSASRDGKISCAQALAMARELKMSPRELGDLLDEIEVRISSCQLGCFP
jgi:hypothetical protein